MKPLPLRRTTAVILGTATAWLGLNFTGPKIGSVPVEYALLAPASSAPTHTAHGITVPAAVDPVTGAPEPFATNGTCAICHSAADTATALWSDTGHDVSPHGLWQGTMMANSFKDPYWRAQVSKEVAAAADGEAAAEVEALCLTCHGPAQHHTQRLRGNESPGVFASMGRPLAEDGVTCTVCHQIQPDGLGTPGTFNGNLPIRNEQKIFGPYPDPSGQPMLMHTGYEATHGEHIRDAAMCGSCHTLHTRHHQSLSAFPEQTPYLEWRNSVYSDEGERESEESQSCQECHMPELGPMRIARNPRGFDFNIPLREEYRGHGFVGANAFMLDLLKDNREALGIEASAEVLERNAKATRRMLAHKSAEIAVEDLAVTDGKAQFKIRVTSKAGHKLPTGYPARRAWLRVQVRSGREVLFDSGGVNGDGSIRGLADPFRNPHHQTITSPEQVQVYEMVALDPDGNPTTHLTRMASMVKDNRLLPRGWQTDGPHVNDTAPKGVDDPDFTGGEDLVHFEVPFTGDGTPVVVAWLLYQPVPPHWADALRSVDSDEARSFVQMYDAADKTPDRLALTIAIGD